MASLLSAQGVQFEHHNIVEDESAAAFLSERGIKTVPVVSVGDVVIVGFDEQRLTDVLGLAIAPTVGGTGWLASKYELVFDALTKAVDRIGPQNIEAPFAKRNMTVRFHVLHIVSFAEGGWLTHRRGKFDIDDMFATAARCETITTVDAIREYAQRVSCDIAAYLRSADTASLEREVRSHYGGQVPVVEVIRIMLRHSAHHLRQLDWLMRSELGIDMEDEVAAAVTGITLPDDLFGA